jgi:hypothetical protein
MSTSLLLDTQGREPILHIHFFVIGVKGY